MVATRDERGFSFNLIEIIGQPTAETRPLLNLQGQPPGVRVLALSRISPGHGCVHRNPARAVWSVGRGQSRPPPHPAAALARPTIVGPQAACRLVELDALAPS
jgi:hypothetical protein